MLCRKQIDNLRTNHQGVYVLQDNSFKFLSKTSEDRQYLEASPKFVAFTCGLVRGSLANLGGTTDSIPFSNFTPAGLYF